MQKNKGPDSTHQIPNLVSLSPLHRKRHEDALGRRKVRQVRCHSKAETSGAGKREDTPSGFGVGKEKEIADWKRKNECKGKQ